MATYVEITVAHTTNHLILQFELNITKLPGVKLPNKFPINSMNATDTFRASWEMSRSHKPEQPPYLSDLGQVCSLVARILEQTILKITSGGKNKLTYLFGLG
jgi:hypothetical protein